MEHIDCDYLDSVDEVEIVVSDFIYHTPGYKNSKHKDLLFIYYVGYNKNADAA